MQEEAFIFVEVAVPPEHVIVFGEVESIASQSRALIDVHTVALRENMLFLVSFRMLCTFADSVSQQ